jgi:pyruvate kinase
MLSTQLPTQELSNPQILLATLRQLRNSVYEEGQEIFSRWRSRIQRQAFIDSSLNLAYYLALRRYDLRPLQAALMPWGLSSLGRIEAKVLANLDAVIATLAAVCQETPNPQLSQPPLEAFFEGDRLLKIHTQELFGNTSQQRRVRIMVTLPTEAASNYEFVRDLLHQGTDCVRINCAHDTPSEWSAMLSHVRLAESEMHRPCQVLMDLSGPKIRIQYAIAPQAKQRVYRGESVLLRRDLPTTIGSHCFQINCTLPDVVDRLEVGAPVWIDDGHIGAVVEKITSEGAFLRITHARAKGEKLRPDKGINFPHTDLHLCPLTDKDRQDLDFIAANADQVDIIGYSFVQKPEDIATLQQELGARLANHTQIPAIVAKIETPAAVTNLPELIVQAAGKQPFGIMIARGDLAVEIGYQRLAEIQEEILWLCEAAHIPVIWATQVLENLVKNGLPSRAEMTDAAMAERAECVMLNKGAYIVEAVTILDDVLTRMEAHQTKKTPQLRALHSW